MGKVLDDTLADAFSATGHHDNSIAQAGIGRESRGGSGKHAAFLSGPGSVRSLLYLTLSSSGLSYKESLQTPVDFQDWKVTVVDFAAAQTICHR